jgi:prepilin-type N-terminal cleavage/methylation domain-containing protein
MTHLRGFTLIELLISLVIFSLISIAALNSVNHMIRSREHQMAHHEANQSLDRAYAHIFQDMTWFVGDIQASQDNLQFVRTQTSREDSVANVTYKITDGKLFRSLESGTTLLLKDVKDLRLSFLSNKNQWVGAFDQATMEETPLLFRLQFITPHLGEVTWVFATPHL